MMNTQEKLVTPPQGPRSVSMTNNNFSTPQSSSGSGGKRIIRKERPSEHELSAIKEAPIVSFQSQKNSSMCVPCDMSYNTSYNPCDFSRLSLDQNDSVHVNRQWHSFSDVREFSEPTMEVTFSDVAHSEPAYPVQHNSHRYDSQRHNPISVNQPSGNYVGNGSLCYSTPQIGSYHQSPTNPPPVRSMNNSSASVSSYSGNPSIVGNNQFILPEVPSINVYNPQLRTGNPPPHHSADCYPLPTGYSITKHASQSAPIHGGFNPPSQLNGPHGNENVPSHYSYNNEFSTYSNRPASQLSYISSVSAMQNFERPASQMSYGGDMRCSASVCSDQQSVISSASDMVEDLTSWQQKHQLHLKHQQETGETTYKFSALQHAADSIIREKDRIIERQKTKLQHLEQQTVLQEESVKRVLALSVTRESNLPVDSLSYRYQGLHLEGTTLPTQLSEVLSKRDQEIESLQQKLGAAEYELDHLKEDLGQKQVMPKEQWEKACKQLKDNEKHIKHCKEQNEEMKDELTNKKNKLKELENYVADLPTKDDHSRKNQEIRKLREVEEVLRSRLKDMDGHETEIKKELSQKDHVIYTLQKDIEKLNNKIAGLCLDLERYQEPDKNGTLLADKNKDIDDLRWENQKLHSDYQKLKKLMDSRQKKFEQFEAKIQVKLKQYEDKSQSDEDTVNAQILELAGKEDELRELRQAMKELSRANQDLLTKNHKLQDKAAELDRIMSLSQQKLERKLFKEINICVTELQTLVETCLQHSEGQDPNLSMLLGVKPSLSDNEEDNKLDGEEALRVKLGKVRELRKEIDMIRDQVSSKLAEVMGDNLNCITQ